MSKASDFIAWLTAQKGAAYVWGAQGQEARSDGTLFLDGKRVSPSWKDWVDERETSALNAERAKSFIHKKLDQGDGNVLLFDCSGLLMRYLKDIRAYFSADKSAAGLFAACQIISWTALVPGDLLFRHNGKKAYHVGVCLGNNLAVEAQGRDAGVVIRPLNAAGEDYWNRCGRLPCLAEPAEVSQVFFAICAGSSVNVRRGPGTEYEIICVAHKNDLMIAVPSDTPGWDSIALRSAQGLVTGYMYKKYIDRIEEA